LRKNQNCGSVQRSQSTKANPITTKVSSFSRALYLSRVKDRHIYDIFFQVICALDAEDVRALFEDALPEILELETQ
jgi:hypothetical protein